VEDYNVRTGMHHIVYADGEDEHLILALERIEWLSKSGGRPKVDEPCGRAVDNRDGGEAKRVRPGYHTRMRTIPG
jgi:hypothetical protein